MSNPRIDEKGNRYGALKVICYCKNKEGRGAWLCQCDCGWCKVVRGSDLRKGKITSCGCRINSRNKSIVDLTGKKFGKLTVIKRADEFYDKNKRKNIWCCQCECGNICYKPGADLTKNKIRSCGCYSNEFRSLKHMKKLTGQHFGELTVLGIEKYNGKNMQKCLCSCGNIIYTTSHSLLIENKISCGCLSGKYSKAEYYINNFLNKENIAFSQEYTFKDLVSENNKRLRFDFALYYNNKLVGLIEYNGGQHYKPCSLFGGEEQFLILQKHDLLKREYCNLHNIPLLIIEETKDFSLMDDKILTFYQTISKVWND